VISRTRKAVLGELQKKKGEGSQPPLLSFFFELTKAQANAEESLSLPPSGLSPEEANQRLRDGMPLLRADELAGDATAITGWFPDILAVFAGHADLFGTGGDSFTGPADPVPAIMARYTGAPVPADFLPGASDAARQLVIQAVLQPYLAARAAELKHLVSQDHWRRGYCPVCGGAPDFAYLEPEVGARWLVCSRCDAEWTFARLECPFCQNGEQRQLSFYADAGGRYRLQVCHVCRNYLKTVDLRKGEEPLLVPVERLYTLDMDRQARAMGYGNGPASDPPEEPQ
jgi:FdhE protein